MEVAAGTNEGITVRWTMDAGDMLGGAMLYQRRTVQLLRISAVALVVVGVVFFAMGDDPIIWLPLLALGVFSAFNLVIGPRRSVKRRGRSLIGEDVVFRVDEKGAHQDFAGGHVWVEWWALTEALEDASVIIIKRDRLPSFFVPKRAFANTSDADAFLAYVRSHLGPKWPAGQVSHRGAPQSDL